MKRLIKSENDSLTKLFIRLNVYLYNFHTLHWRIKDKNFDILHALMEEYYDKLFDDIDNVAEFMISNNIRIPSLKEIANSDTSLLDTNKDYSEEDLNESIVRFFTSILNTIQNCYELDYIDKNPGFKSTLDEMFAYYDKEANYKQKQRK